MVEEGSIVPISRHQLLHCLTLLHTSEVYATLLKVQQQLLTHDHSLRSKALELRMRQLQQGSSNAIRLTDKQMNQQTNILGAAGR
jgi:hypothetical protein